MSAYYNEFDGCAAEWLRNLIAAGHIAPGDVDTRSIVDVQPDDLRGYDQCHFFAGIGGWSLALRLAGWPDDHPVWTGSCPCQPFSAAGKQKGTADERHLWPEFFRLIAECHPAIVFGEQVEAAVRHGWLDGVFRDLEGEGYACGAAVLGAHSVGAPHIRQRLFWVADADRERYDGRGPCGTGWNQFADSGNPGRLADADGGVAGHGSLQSGGQHGQQPQDSRAGGLEHAARNGREQRRTESSGRGAAGGCSENFWSGAEWLPCTDGKARRVKPGLQPLAHGIPGRVGRLRGYGNAIVPPLAAQFILTAQEAIDAAKP